MDTSPNAASVALVEGGRVLLIRRARAPALGKWTLPGGRLEPGEDAEAAAVREVREELGLAVAALRPVTRLTAGTFRLQVFATDAFEGAIAAGEEISGCRWVRADEVGGLDAPPHLAEGIGRALRRLGRR